MEFGIINHNPVHYPVNKYFNNEIRGAIGDGVLSALPIFTERELPTILENPYQRITVAQLGGYAAIRLHIAASADGEARSGIAIHCSRWNLVGEKIDELVEVIFERQKNVYSPSDHNPPLNGGSGESIFGLRATLNGRQLALVGRLLNGETILEPATAGHQNPRTVTKIDAVWAQPQLPQQQVGEPAQQPDAKRSHCPQQ